MILCPICYQNKTKKTDLGLYVCENACCFFSPDKKVEKILYLSATGLKEIKLMKKCKWMWE